MRLKQKLAAMLAILLIMQHGFPAFAIAADELQGQTETVTIQDSDTSSEPSDVLPELEVSPTEPPATPADADEPQESEPPEADGGATVPSPPEENNTTADTPKILPTDVTESVQETPSLTTELVLEGDEPGLWITLPNVPAELSEVNVRYLFGSGDFNLWVDGAKTWYTNPNDEQPLCRIGEDGSVKILCYGLDEHPLSAYLAGAVNSLWIQVIYDTQDYTDGMTFEPVLFAHENIYEIPKTPPPFTAEFVLGWFSYAVEGHFTDFPPNVAQVSSTYSWDGITYESSMSDDPMRWDLQKLGSSDPADIARLQNQECAKYYCEPLKSFLAHERDSFYLRLEITTEEGEVYYSQPALMSRGETEAIPEHLMPRAYMGFDMSVSESRNDKGLSEDDENYYAELVTYTYGQLQLTVCEDATWEEIKALLPDTVPVRVRFWDKRTGDKVAFGDVSCPVNWKEPPDFSLTPGVPLTLEDMAEPLVIPTGTVVKTDLAEYILAQPLTFDSPYDSDDIRLILNPIATDEEPQVGLRAGEDWNGNDVMSLAFWQKPSGAVAIEAYTIVGEQRTLICDLLDRRDVNHNQSHALYGYVPLLGANEAPYADFLSGGLDSYAIELVIKGGVYDGKTVTLPWPQDYDLPEEVFDPSGTEGNENNAGSGGENGNDNGQRPDLPEEPEQKPDLPEEPDQKPDLPGEPEQKPDKEPERPPIIPPPAENHPQVPEQMPPPDPPEDTAPGQPQPDSAEKAADEEGIMAAAQPLTSPPQLVSNTPAMSIQRDQTASTPPAPTESPQADERAVPAPLGAGNEIDAEQRSGNKPEAERGNNALPIAATAAIVLVGGGIAVSAGVGAASGTVSGSGFLSKLLRTLRKLFHRP